MWGWEHYNLLEEREMEALRLDKDETAAEWLDPAPRLRQDILALKRLTALKKPAVTRCRASESMANFFCWDMQVVKGLVQDCGIMKG